MHDYFSVYVSHDIVVMFIFLVNVVLCHNNKQRCQLDDGTNFDEYNFQKINVSASDHFYYIYMNVACKHGAPRKYIDLRIYRLYQTLAVISHSRSLLYYLDPMTRPVFVGLSV